MEKTIVVLVCTALGFLIGGIVGMIAVSAFLHAALIGAGFGFLVGLCAMVDDFWFTMWICEAFDGFDFAWTD